MTLSRRDILKASSIGAVPVLTALSGCQTTMPPTKPELNKYSEHFLGPENDPVFNRSSTETHKITIGDQPSRHQEVTKAFRLLWDAPRTDNHYNIAQYFEGITDTNPLERNYSGSIAKYNEEWTSRANPLITAFFGMTNTRPSYGDQTAWCAAFVSFVLYAGNKPNMFSALSGSYRNYLTATTNPKIGDIVVFEKYGEAGANGFGHVGFFVSETDSNVTVLGGNQRGNTGSSGAVVKSVYAKIGRTQKLHSYRSVPL